MDKVIDLNEKRKLLEEKKLAIKLKSDKERKLEELVSDMETILFLVNKGEITDIDMLFTFKEKNCYYGFRDILDQELIKDRLNNIYKQVKFE